MVPKSNLRSESPWLLLSQKRSTRFFFLEAPNLLSILGPHRPKIFTVERTETRHSFDVFTAVSKKNFPRPRPLSAVGLEALADSVLRQEGSQGPLRSVVRNGTPLNCFVLRVVD